MPIVNFIDMTLAAGIDTMPFDEAFVHIVKRFALGRNEMQGSPSGGLAFVSCPCSTEVAAS